MSKLSPTDTLQDVMVKLCEGNPGALDCLMRMYQNQNWKVPNMNGFTYIMMFDQMGLYGSRLYQLWNDCCDRDLDQIETVLYNILIGTLSSHDVLSNINQGYGTPFSDLTPIPLKGES